MYTFPKIGITATAVQNSIPNPHKVLLVMPTSGETKFYNDYTEINGGSYAYRHLDWFATKLANYNASDLKPHISILEVKTEITEPAKSRLFCPIDIVGGGEVSIDIGDRAFTVVLDNGDTADDATLKVANMLRDKAVGVVENVQDDGSFDFAGDLAYISSIYVGSKNRNSSGLFYVAAESVTPAVLVKASNLVYQQSGAGVFDLDKEIPKNFYQSIFISEAVDIKPFDKLSLGRGNVKNSLTSGSVFFCLPKGKKEEDLNGGNLFNNRFLTKLAWSGLCTISPDLVGLSFLVARVVRLTPNALGSPEFIKNSYAVENRFGGDGLRSTPYFSIDLSKFFRVEYSSGGVDDELAQAQATVITKTVGANATEVLEAYTLSRTDDTGQPDNIFNKLTAVDTNLWFQFAVFNIIKQRFPQNAISAGFSNTARGIVNSDNIKSAVNVVFKEALRLGLAVGNGGETLGETTFLDSLSAIVKGGVVNVSFIYFTPVSLVGVNFSIQVTKE